MKRRISTAFFVLAIVAADGNVGVAAQNTAVTSPASTLNCPVIIAAPKPEVSAPNGPRIIAAADAPSSANARILTAPLPSNSGRVIAAPNPQPGSAAVLGPQVRPNGC